MTVAKPELKLKNYRIPYGEELIFKPRFNKISVINLLSLDGFEERQSLYKDLFSTFSKLPKNTISREFACIAYKDLVINENHKKCKTIAIYGNATIDTDINCNILFVNGNLTINKHLKVKLLIVTGNVISKHSDLIVTTFHVGKNLEANCIFFTGKHYANFCIVGGNCKTNQIGEYASLPETDPYQDELIVKGNFFCKGLNLSRKLSVFSKHNSICKIGQINENQKFSLEANHVEITEEAHFHHLLKCDDLITHSLITSSSSILCDGNFIADGNIKSSRIIVKGNFILHNGSIATANEVTVYGNIKGEIHSINLRTYVHVFE